MIDKSNARSMNLIRRLAIRAQMTYTGLERSQSLSVELILTSLAESEVAKATCLRFKE